MAHFDKTSSEYKDNGHYEINGTEFMSIWTFKKTHKILDPDRNKQRELNKNESLDIKAKYSSDHTTTPDFGEYNKINLYKVTDLEEYYGF
jgi:hypothetical protein